MSYGLKFIADVNISPSTVRELTQNGFLVKRVTKYLSAKAPDNEIIQLAIRQKAVVITQDLDFSALMVQSGLNWPSIISLRLPNAKPKHVTKILLTILPEIETDLMDGVIVSVEEAQYRVRKLPV